MRRLWRNRWLTASIGTILVLTLLWYFVLDNVAVYRRIPLEPGTTVTKNFWTNYSGFYTLGIQAQRKFPHEKLQCLLGINDESDVNNCTETRLRYSWILSCDGGRVKYSGTSDKIVGGAYATDWMETQFGAFEAKHWEWCQLKINFIDASPLLSRTDPKLNVYTELF